MYALSFPHGVTADHFQTC